MQRYIIQLGANFIRNADLELTPYSQEAQVYRASHVNIVCAPAYRIARDNRGCPVQVRNADTLVVVARFEFFRTE